MEHYKKGGVNIQDSDAKPPLPDLPDDFTWMRVKAGSKIHNLLHYAFAKYEEKRLIVWSASGAAITKAISCVQIMKQKHPSYQITRIDSRK